MFVFEIEFEIVIAFHPSTKVQNRKSSELVVMQRVGARLSRTTELTIIGAQERLSR